MTIKLIAFDLDNTLLNSKKEISPRNEDILKKLHEKGLKIVLTTGRPIKGIVPYIEQLDLKKEEDFSINFNGGTVQHNASHKIISSRFLTKEQIKPIAELALKMKFPIDVVSIDKGFSVIDVEKSGYQKFIHGLMDFVDLPFADLPENLKYYKFVSQTDPDKVLKIQKYLSDYPSLTIVKSRPNLLEFLPKGVNKQSGLKELLAHFGWDFDNLMAFGDQENDLGMIKAAKVGVAVANAIDEVKREADVITKNNDEDGVGVFLEKYFENVF